MRSCSIDGCDRKHNSLGYCEMHYARFKRHGDPSIVQKADEYCSADECGNKPVGHGYCRKHYTRWQRYGNIYSVSRRSRTDLSCRVKSCFRWPYATNLCVEHHTCFDSRLPVEGVCSVEFCDRDIYSYDLCLRHKATVAGFGLSIAMYENLLKYNKGRCLICDNGCDKPYIDHDHRCCNRTGSCGGCVRGILCSFCNFGLGQFRDSIVYLSNAVNYLAKNPSLEDLNNCGDDKFELLPHRSLNKHNLSKVQYVVLLDLQAWRCGICNEPFVESPNVDHDHLCCPEKRSCGQCVRGLLCRWCNNGLGYFRDRVPSLERAKQYLAQPYVVENYNCDCSIEEGKHVSYSEIKSMQ